MSLTIDDLRRRFVRLKQSRARVAAAQASFRRDFKVDKFDPDRAERVQRKLAEARQALKSAFEAGLALLSSETERLVRQHVDEPAALQKILEIALVRRVRRARRRQERSPKAT